MAPTIYFVEIRANTNSMQWLPDESAPWQSKEPALARQKELLDAGWKDRVRIAEYVRVAEREEDLASQLQSHDERTRLEAAVKVLELSEKQK